MNVRLTTLVVAAASSLVSLPASALVARAYVSGGGSDANTAVNCSLTQPCRTFQTAMTVLNDGGEVIALDSAGYGTVTITKSVSLIAPTGIFAGLTPTSGNGVTIATAGVTVNLRGLTINNQGGTYGINMSDGAKLNVENVVISGFSTGYGLNVQAAAVVAIKNVTIMNTAVGMKFGSGATASVTNSSLQGISTGIHLEGGSSGTTTVSVADTSIVGNGSGNCTKNWASSGTTGRLSLMRVTATSCNEGVQHWPITANAAHMTSVSNSLIMGNTYGLVNSGGAGDGTFYSAGNNQVVGNGTDLMGTITTGGVH